MILELLVQYYKMILHSLISLFIILVSAVAINLYIKISLKKGFLDKPEAFNMHLRNTPTGSGIVFLMLFLLFVIILKIFENSNLFNLIYPNRYYLFIISITFLSLISFYDDLKQLHPNIRLFFQVIFVGLSLALIEFNLLVEYIPLKFLYLLVVLFWVYKINCINFIDGLDGFLTSYILFFFLNCSIFFYFNLIDSFYYFVSIFLFSISVSFLFFNKPVAKVFMGDAGSIFFGYAVGFFSLYFLSIERLDIMISLICYPFVDCSLTLINKTLKGYYPWDRLFDYYFLKPVKKNNKTHSYVLKFFLIYLFFLSINLLLQILYEYKYLCILSIIYTLSLIKIFSKK